MNESVSLNVDVTLSTKTCVYGHFYAVPYWMEPANYLCPMCASGELSVKRDLIYSLEKTISENLKSMAALRGAITRFKRRKR